MKQILAILMALVLVFAFAACGSTGENDSTEAPETTVESTENNTTPEETTEVADVDATTAATDTDATTNPDATTVADQTTSANVELDVNDKQSIIDYYNAAVIKTDVNPPKGNQTMLLSKDMDGDGAIGLIAKAKTVLKNNSTESDWIPGDGLLKLSDCESVSATVNNGVVTVNIKLKSQVDGSNANGRTDGPVARGIGTLGSIDQALDQMGATLSEGRDTVFLTYKNATIKATIDQKTGRVTSGTWKYTVDILIKDAKGTISNMSAPLKNITAAVDYSVVI